MEERALLHAFSALPSVFSTQSFPCPLLWVHLECQLLKRNVKIGFGIFFKRNVKIGFGFPTHKSKWGIHVLALVFIYKNWNDQMKVPDPNWSPLRLPALIATFLLQILHWIWELRIDLSNFFWGGNKPHRLAGPCTARVAAPTLTSIVFILWMILIYWGWEKWELKSAIVIFSVSRRTDELRNCSDKWIWKCL